MQLVRPKKQLGQHFLTDQTIAVDIVEALSLPTEAVIEIGPGMGVLTKYLLQKVTFKTYLVEIDNESITYLQATYPSLGNRLINADFLRIDIPSLIPYPTFSVIGNFPYNISTQLVFKLIEYRQHVIEVVGMFQKEVAERIAGKPNSKTYGILSVYAQAFFDIEYLFTVPEHVFHPPPKVKSGVIRMVRNTNHRLACDEKKFLLVIKTAFNQRRKMLSNALKPLGKDTTMLPEGLQNKRAENLSVEDYVCITNLFFAGE